MPRLIVVCHGIDMGNNYSYKININGRQRADYAERLKKYCNVGKRKGV